MLSTISFSVSNCREDGAKDIVAQMGTPFLVRWQKIPYLKNEYEKNILEKNKKKKKGISRRRRRLLSPPPSPLKFVHNYPITTLSFSGLERGQTIAEGHHSMGGYLCPYTPWQEDNEEHEKKDDAFKFRGKKTFFGEM